MPQDKRHVLDTAHLVYAIPLAEAQAAVRKLACVEPSTWRCPCAEVACAAWVVFGRDSAGCLIVMMTMSHEDRFPILKLDRPQDVDGITGYQAMNESDRGVLHVYLSNGLRAVLRGAFVGRA